MKKFYKISIFVILFFSCLFRLIIYIGNRPMWHDESSLALSIIKRSVFGYFAPLEHLQSAPPAFMVLTKALSCFFGQSELALRFIPFICAIGSVFAFYFLTKKIFDKKYLIIIANLLFALNIRLIYFAQEFKQYSTEVLIVILALLFLSKFDIKKLTVKNASLFAILAFVPFLTALPYAFVLAGFIIYKIIFDNKNLNKGFFVFLSVILVLGIIYYFAVLMPSQVQMLNNHGQFWESGFLKLNPASFLGLTKFNLDYFFAPNAAVLLSAVLIIWGGILSFLSKKDIYKFIFLVLFTGIFASLMHIYPIRDRVALWSVPLIIILALLPIEILNVKKHRFAAVIFSVCLVFGFYKYDFSYIKILFEPDSYTRFKNFPAENARHPMQIIKNEFREDLGEVIVFNDASDSEFYYYSHIYKLNTNRYVKIKLVEYSKDFYTQTLSQLPKGYTYWFYYPFDYPSRPVVSYLDDWLKVNASQILLLENKDGYYFAKARL